ncbi:hypothetical protein ES319_D02G084200v1 [Gossypium barbadense]|uniref:Uncharacterized protein n=1 Tax=Gossypium barbadense TaxID=3634 RepID=A0A5J5SER5_GOSBA|nr:hypothetical protein ES319_D02G084200v1 [Gossypium barbadense]
MKVGFHSRVSQGKGQSSTNGECKIVEVWPTHAKLKCIEWREHWQHRSKGNESDGSESRDGQAQPRVEDLARRPERSHSRRRCRLKDREWCSPSNEGVSRLYRGECLAS